MSMFATSLVLVLSTLMVSAQPLADKSLDGVATKIINLAVTTKKSKKTGKLVKGGLAGVIVGIVITVIILLLIAFLLYKRQQKKKALGVNTVDQSHVHGHEQGKIGTEGSGLAPPLVHDSNGVPVQQRTDGAGHV